MNHGDAFNGGPCGEIPRLAPALLPVPGVLLSALRARVLAARDADLVRPEAPTARRSLNMMTAMTDPAPSAVSNHALPCERAAHSSQSVRHRWAKP